MQIKAVKIKGYRTIKDEIDLTILNDVTIVGPNNSGKTNLLKAIRIFFTGYDNVLGYSREADLSFDQTNIQTNISVTFLLDNKSSDAEILNNLDAVQKLLEIHTEDMHELTVYLTFSTNSKPTYRVFPNSKRPSLNAQKVQYSRAEKKLVESILESFSVYYIPSEKSTMQLYHDLVTPFLMRKLYDTVRPHLTEIRGAMQNAANALDTALASAGLTGISCSFSVPEHPDRLFKEINFSLKDPSLTDISAKGMGIQSAALLAAFNWITTEERKANKNVLWLLEEPESYLHPELAQKCRSLIAKLATSAQVVTTTHSLGFVPEDPRKIIGVQRIAGWTSTENFKTYISATRAIRKSLGVRFSDFYNLDALNLLVEGETDREYFYFFRAIIRDDPSMRIKFPLVTSDRLAVLDYGGVKGLEGFVRATYELIRDERPCIILLDGDAAGDKCRKDLQHYFGSKNIHLVPNKHFVIVRDRFSIEGLFPDEWIVDLQKTNPGWFESYSQDAAGILQPFSLRDDQKKPFLSAMTGRAAQETTKDWMKRWIEVFLAIEAGLQAEVDRIYGNTSGLMEVAALQIANADGAVAPDPVLPETIAAPTEIVEPLYLGKIAEEAPVSKDK